MPSRVLNCPLKSVVQTSLGTVVTSGAEPGCFGTRRGLRFFVRPRRSRMAPAVEGAGSVSSGCRLARYGSSFLGPQLGRARRASTISLSTSGEV